MIGLRESGPHTGAFNAKSENASLMTKAPTTAAKRILEGGAMIALVSALGGQAFAEAPLVSDVVQAPVHSWRPVFLVKPPGAAAQQRLRLAALGSSAFRPASTSTIPYWTTQITSPLDHQTYQVSMVGASPYAGNATNTQVPYVPVALRIHLRGHIIDPTATSHCDTQSASTRFFNSPIFKPLTTITSNGVNVAASGGSQLLSGFQRANFWTAVSGTTYGVSLTPTRTTPIVVDWTPKKRSDTVVSVADNCGGTIYLAEVDINELDTELQTIARTYANPTQIPMTLVADTAIYQNTTSNCCILGYHNAISLSTGTQVYAVGAYYTSDNVFGPHFADITIWTHELAELMDDPFVQSIPSIPGGVNSDLTPAWGHTGQVTGCQNNLEAGDPLTPDQGGNYPNYGITGVGGFVYHYQDLPFHDWFYRTASTSTGGRYSFVGNFTSVQGTCV